MLDYGFEHFPLEQITVKGQKIQGQSLVSGRDFIYPFAHGEEEKLVKKLVLRKPGNPDLSFGMRGYIELLLEGQKIGQVPVYAEGSTIPDIPQQKLRQRTASASAPYGALSLWESAREVLKSLFGGERN